MDKLIEWKSMCATHKANWDELFKTVKFACVRVCVLACGVARYIYTIFNMNN